MFSFDSTIKTVCIALALAPSLFAEVRASASETMSSQAETMTLVVQQLVEMVGASERAEMATA